MQYIYIAVESLKSIVMSPLLPLHKTRSFPDKGNIYTLGLGNFVYSKIYSMKNILPIFEKRRKFGAFICLVAATQWTWVPDCGVIFDMIFLSCSIQ